MVKLCHPIKKITKADILDILNIRLRQITGTQNISFHISALHGRDLT